MNIKQLHKLFLQYNSICTDTRNLKKNDLFFALKGENFNGNKFAKIAIDAGASFAIVDEASYTTDSNKIILVDNVLKTLQELARFHRQYLNVPILALTGSNGKTTTKELIHAVLSQKYKTVATKGNLNNHIGVPLTLLSMQNDTEIGIVEMGANHLNEIDFLCEIALPDYGYITNFGKAHLEGFGSLDGVIQGKTELYRHLMKKGKTLFVNGHDSMQMEMSKGCKRVLFGNDDNFDTTLQFIQAQPNVEIKYKDIEIHSQLIGAYNYTNIAAAICIAEFFEVDTERIKFALEKYVPENNRSQIIHKNSTKIILDAYNANPSSMTEALENFNRLTDKYKIAILGDMFELGNEAENEHNAIANLAADLYIDELILIGENFCGIQNKSIKSYNSFDAFKKEFNKQDFNNATLLIKGSRGMALERILELL
jgi:UDP-N-acetylmuramoyl-tripeptide--D-alanyl-D-alanine ligase